jgi:UDPglucose 6-dehydrogenase
VAKTGGVSIIGLGKLGSPMAACFAAAGVPVVGVDSDERRMRDLEALRAPVREPGLAELLGRSGGRLRTTGSVAEAVAATDVTMIVVPTPSEPEGGFSLRHAHHACEAVGRALAAKDGYHVVAMTSTVMPGATAGPLREDLERASGQRAGDGFGLCYSPEFIALGSVIRDFTHPDFLLIGESDERAGDVLQTLYAHVCENSPPVARMSLVDAEVAKLAVNSYVTTKISFANMVARICEALPGADADVVTAAIGLDSRIGAKCLKGAIGYGGPCFPRDNKALAALARSVGAPADVAETTDRFNRAEADRLRDRIFALVEPGETVAVLGLSYKPGTDVTDESPGLALAMGLAAAGVEVVGFDPVASPDGVRLAGSLDACLDGADVVVIATPWEEFRTLGARLGRARVVVDCWRILDPASLNGTAHVALGLGPPA